MQCAVQSTICDLSQCSLAPCRHHGCIRPTPACSQRTRLFVLWGCFSQQRSVFSGREAGIEHQSPSVAAGEFMPVTASTGLELPSAVLYYHAAHHCYGGGEHLEGLICTHLLAQVSRHAAVWARAAGQGAGVHLGSQCVFSLIAGTDKAMASLLQHSIPCCILFDSVESRNSTWRPTPAPEGRSEGRASATLHAATPPKVPGVSCCQLTASMSCCAGDSSVAAPVRAQSVSHAIV